MGSVLMRPCKKSKGFMRLTKPVTLAVSTHTLLANCMCAEGKRPRCRSFSWTLISAIELG